MHSVSGVLRLMWMLSIQMCPLVPCAKKPSITTYRGKTGGGGGRSQRETRQTRTGDKGEEEDEKKKKDN